MRQYNTKCGKSIPSLGQGHAAPTLAKVDRRALSGPALLRGVLLHLLWRPLKPSARARPA